MLDRRAFAATSALLLALGCGDSHMTGGDEDAAIVIPDGALRDAGTDSGPPPSAVGAPCAADTDCTGAANTCLTEATSGLPGGYCSAICTSDEDCPSDATCVQIDRTNSVCLASCDPAGTDECRAGYGCASGIGAPNVCIPGCEEDTDCPGDLRCDPNGGDAGEGSCYDPSAAVGDACESFAGEDCPMGGACLVEFFYGWPAGTCVQVGCDAAANTGCPDGDVCLDNGDTGLCVAGCEADGDCRDGYRCRASAADGTRKACFPGCTDDTQCTGTSPFGGSPQPDVCNAGTGYCSEPFNPEELGSMCTGRRFECRGGACLTEEDDGWPGGMCTFPGCSLSGATPSEPCPEGGVCIDDGGGDPDIGVCVPSCTVGDTTCRSGYVCVAVSDGSTDGACRPACTADSCPDGTTCNAETGVCE